MGLFRRTLVGLSSSLLHGRAEPCQDRSVRSLELLGQFDSELDRQFRVADQLSCEFGYCSFGFIDLRVFRLSPGLASYLTQKQVKQYCLAFLVRISQASS